MKINKISLWMIIGVLVLTNILWIIRAKESARKMIQLNMLNYKLDSVMNSNVLLHEIIINDYNNFRPHESLNNKTPIEMIV